MPLDVTDRDADTVVTMVSAADIRQAVEQVAIDLYVAEAMCAAVLERMDEARRDPAPGLLS
jgi:hypothetical protein